MEEFTSKIARLLSSNGAAPPPSFHEGHAAYRDGDFEKAQRLLQPLAEQGDAAAQTALGAMYYFGEGVPQDHAISARWTRVAAETSNLPELQRMVGFNYLLGRGEP